MRRLGPAAAAFALAAVGLATATPTATAAATAAAAAPIPLPDQDPFYAVPAHIAKLRNGAILKFRPVAVSAFGLPMAARAWQVQYKSLDTHGRTTADVATVLVPMAAWRGTGARPLVSYQTAEDGVGSKCSPSYALRAGLAAIGSNSESETGLIELALLQGWAVVAPDYEGPYSDFLGAGQEAHGVLDGVRAALVFGPAGFRAQTKIGLWGYSGGALASDLAAQAQPTYAPELKLAGVALGGVVGDIRATLEAFSGSPFGGAIVMGFVGANRSYPEAHLLRYLNAAGRRAVASAQSDCINDAAARFPFASFSQYEASPGVLELPAVTALLREMSPLTTPGIPTAPIYDYHSVLDELAPLSANRKLMTRFCAAGTRVDHVESLLGEHILFTAAGAPGAISYLGARFNGAPPPSNCPSIPRS
jgi:hypothetical protein